MCAPAVRIRLVPASSLFTITRAIPGAAWGHGREAGGSRGGHSRTITAGTSQRAACLLLMTSPPWSGSQQIARQCSAWRPRCPRSCSQAGAAILVESRNWRPENPGSQHCRSPTNEGTHSGHGGRPGAVYSTSQAIVPPSSYGVSFTISQSGQERRVAFEKCRQSTLGGRRLRLCGGTRMQQSACGVKARQVTSCSTVRVVVQSKFEDPSTYTCVLLTFSPLYIKKQAAP
jgi:hypothetical protein